MSLTWSGPFSPTCGAVLIMYYVMDQAFSLPLNGRRLNTGGQGGELNIISPGPGMLYAHGPSVPVLE